MANAKSGEFVRKFDNIAELKNDQLFKDCLAKDIKDGVVFPAVRGGRMDFYHKGGKLFSYNDKFSTHYKYASVIKPNNPKTQYLDESALEKCIHVTKFVDSYTGIKSLCSLYANNEAIAVSDLFTKYSSASSLGQKQNIVVLDIEVSFKRDTLDGEVSIKNGTGKSRAQDRIDLLLFNKKHQQLRFCEVKLLSNKELMPESDGAIPVVGQLGKYNKQLVNNYDRIIQQYQRHVQVLNTTFDCDLPNPLILDKETRLLIFDYDDDQKHGKLDSVTAKLMDSDKSLIIYPKGKTKSLSLETLWDKTSSPSAL